MVEPIQSDVQLAQALQKAYNDDAYNEALESNEDCKYGFVTNRRDEAQACAESLNRIHRERATATFKRIPGLFVDDYRVVYVDEFVDCDQTVFIDSLYPSTNLINAQDCANSMNLKYRTDRFTVGICQQVWRIF